MAACCLHVAKVTGLTGKLMITVGMHTMVTIIVLLFVQQRGSSREGKQRSRDLCTVLK